MCPALQTSLHNRDEVGGAVRRLEVPCKVTPKFGGGEQEGTHTDCPILLTRPNRTWALQHECEDEGVTSKRLPNPGDTYTLPRQDTDTATTNCHLSFRHTLAHYWPST